MTKPITVLQNASETTNGQRKAQELFLTKKSDDNDNDNVECGDDGLIFKVASSISGFYKRLSTGTEQQWGN